MRVFADSFYFIALLHERDAHHEQILRFSLERRVRVITTRWVLAEVADALWEALTGDRHFAQAGFAAVFAE